MPTKTTGRGRDWRKNRGYSRQLHHHHKIICRCSRWCEAIDHVLRALKNQHPDAYQRLRTRLSGFHVYQGWMPSGYFRAGWRLARGSSQGKNFRARVELTEDIDLLSDAQIEALHTAFSEIVSLDVVPKRRHTAQLRGWKFAQTWDVPPLKKIDDPERAIELED